MFVLKIVAVLSLAVAANASDLEKGLAIMKCAQRAITYGVPELGIPSHEPYVVIKHNLNITKEILGNTVDLSLHDLTWSGLARWDLSATQKSSDWDQSADFDYVLHWDWMALNGTFDVTLKTWFSETKKTIKFSFDYQNTDWIGSLSVLKPTESSDGTVNYSKIDWHVKTLNVYLDGLGIFDQPIGAAIANGVSNACNTDAIGNLIGEFIKMRLTTIWWDTGKVWKLTDWCKSNPLV